MSSSRRQAVKAPAPPAPSWLTARADSGGVPALLERLAATVPVESMDEVWIFPTRRMPGFESTVVVLSLFTDDADDRRRVVTAHFKAVRNKRGEATVETILSDHAVAPPDRLERIIDGVLRRLGDDSVLATPPRSAQLRGKAERWTVLVQAVESGHDIPAFTDTEDAEGAEVGLGGAMAVENAETESAEAEGAETDGGEGAETDSAEAEGAEGEVVVAPLARMRDEAHETTQDVQTENEGPR